MSRVTDVSGTEEIIRKGKMAERTKRLTFYPWAWREERHDCHRRMESYPNYTDKYILERRILPFLLLFTHSLSARCIYVSYNR